MSVNAPAPASPTPSASMHQETAAALRPASSPPAPLPPSLLPAPVPLRPSLSTSPPPSPAIRSLFDREYDTLLQWNRHLFLTFTQEIQRSLGSTLKKYVRSYGLAAAIAGNDFDARAPAPAHSDLFLKTFAEAREAVISVREVTYRIVEHAAWLASDVNQTRLELMNLRYNRNPYTVLREAMDLTTTIRSFILELTVAMQRNDGVPWLLERKSDCSDVSPEFVENMAKSIVSEPDRSGE